ncbi:MAG: class I SAM-dependent methyltransferase [Cyclobacteriaceae bacterium]|nr:class I SAM-dependent methyltransferase [Cyclobacteriaceae bacterium]
MNPLPVSDDLDSYYKANYWFEHHKVIGVVQMDFDEKNVSKRTIDIYSSLSNYLSNKSYVLEIGSGFGHTLAYIAHKKSATVYGVELSEEGAKNSREVYGISVFNGSWEKFDAASDIYDVVIMSHVLEHFPDPLAALKKVADVSKKGAIIYVEVPNILYPTRSKNLKNWLSKEHISYFSVDKLKFLLTKAGFDTIQVVEKNFVRIIARASKVSNDFPIRNEYRQVKAAIQKHTVNYFFYRVLRKLKLTSRT